jgi:hypothetical protein
MSDRSDLRNTILATVKEFMTRPKFKATEALADALTTIVRQAQHDAWTRGYAAAQLDEYRAKSGRRLQHRSPYRGGRHTGPYNSWKDRGAPVVNIGGIDYADMDLSEAPTLHTITDEDGVILHNDLPLAILRNGQGPGDELPRTDEQVEWDDLALPPQRVVLDPLVFQHARHHLPADQPLPRRKIGSETRSQETEHAAEAHHLVVVEGQRVPMVGARGK